MWVNNCYRFSIIALVLLFVGCGGSGSSSGHKSSVATSLPTVISSSAQQTLPSSASSVSSANSSLKSTNSSLSSSSSGTGGITNSEKMFRQVSMAEQVVGFEDPNRWLVFIGDKSVQAALSEGLQSLKIENFRITNLRSESINSLRGIGDQLSIDVLSVADSTIEMEVAIAISTLGVNQKLTSIVPAAELKAGQITRIDFAIPQSIKNAIGNEYDDLRFEIAIKSEKDVAALTLDNLRFTQSVPSEKDKVEIEFQMPDDFAYLMVNGIQRRVWANHVYGSSSTGKVDITSLFWQGLNRVRVQGVNSGSYHQLIFKLWVNGEQVVDKTCKPNVCGYQFQQGVFYDSVFVLNTPNLPPAKIVSVTGAEGANLYLDDLFIDQKIPAQLRLPQGSYRIGAGEYSDSPFNYRSNFYERTIQLADTNQLLDFTNDQPLGVQHTTKVAIVPIRNTKLVGGNRTAVLTDNDIELFRTNVQMANDTWIVPLSYGLQKWDITVLPTVENHTLELPTLLSSFGVGEWLTGVGLGSIKSQYEIIIAHYSGYDTNRLRIDGGGGAGASAGGGYMIVPNVWPFVKERPHAVILHEALHIYEHAQRDLRYLYNGANGLHGAGIHGYTPLSSLGEEDWVGWYRMFARNAVKETIDMRDLKERTQPSDSADIHIGVFDTMRHGLGFLH